MGEGKARARRVPLDLPAFSRGEENAMLWERQAARPQEQAALGRAVAATTNRCGRRVAGECRTQVTAAAPPLLSTESPGGNRSLCFLPWASRAVWCLDQPCSEGGREEGRICGLPTYISVEVG